MLVNSAQCCNVKCKNPNQVIQYCQIMRTNNPDTFSFPGKRLSNFFCREKVNVSQPMLEACLPCQKYTTHWKSSSGCLSSSSAAPPPPSPPLPSFFSLSSSSYSTGTQYLRAQSEIRQWLTLKEQYQASGATSPVCLNAQLFFFFLNQA